MKISETWLREWVNPDLDSEHLAHTLTMLGLEVESIQPVAQDLADIVVGEVLDVAPHPNADRLSLCRVDVGRRKPLAVVCGAANVQAAARYPVALVGARLPGGLEIKASEIRGQASEGMLCSAVELGIADSADGILQLDPDSEIGLSIAEALGLDDHIIDLDLTPNRADCFSVIGIARDLAASQGMKMTVPEIIPVAASIDHSVPVKIKRGAGCGRFVGRVIRNIDAHAQTPVWITERLRRSGIRPIHPVVDVTNYVMLELGQPLHGYDHGLLRDRIIVRRAKDKEQLTLLDGQEVRLDPSMLVIADAKAAIGLAGIMGGQSTAVSAATRDIYLESAFFSPDVIAGRARKFGLHTDASVRFERGVDPAHQARAVERATGLLLKITGGEAGPLVEVTDSDALSVNEPIMLRRDRLAALLGVNIPDKDVADTLTGLDMLIEVHEQGWIVTPPSARFDINLEADLIEEVVRLYGYDRIPELAGSATSTLGSLTEGRVPLERVRTALVDRGYQEAITYSFVDGALDRLFADGATGLALSNPISSEMAVMRQSLWPGLVQALRHNLSRQRTRVRLFESGIRFLCQDTDILEEGLISGIATGLSAPEQWDGTGQPADLFDIKADLEALFKLTGAAEEFEFKAAENPALHPGRTAEIFRSGEHVGWLGELHPALIKKLDLSGAPVLFELSAMRALTAKKAEFRGISKFPAVRRDLAVIVDRDLPAATLEAAVREAGGPTLRETVMFDIYEGKNVETGSKSVALGLILQQTSRTLTDTDVDDIMHSVKDCLSRKFNATIRE